MRIPFVRQPEIKEIAYNNGTEIFNVISNAILQSQSSIKVAAAWFTDRDLFEAIKTKISQTPTLRVEIVLDDNKENYFLPFAELVKLGATVKLLKGKDGNGRMHHKFCIIDEKKVYHGSYNWSKNAKYNNYETLTVSEDEELVKQFISIFSELVTNSSAYDIEHLKNYEETVEYQNNTEEVNRKSKFEKFIEEVIFSEVYEYDREALRRQGYDRSENSSGDHNIIRYELNSVYTDFVNDINLSDTRKENLKTTIQHHAINELNLLQKTFEKDKEAEIQKNDSETRVLKYDIQELKANKERLEAEIKNVEEVDIKQKQNQIEAKEKEYSKINSERQSFKKRAYVLIPSIVFLALTILYLLIFYSSASYILVYASDDAMKAKLRGENIPPVEIFHSKAIQLAFEKGPFNLAFIFLFPIFIMGLLFMLNQIKTTWKRWLSELMVIIPVDVFVAYKIASEIHENEYLRGMTNEQWHWTMVFSSSDFYIVLVFGAMAFFAYALLSKFITDEVGKYFDEDAYPKLQQLKEEIDRLRTGMEEMKRNLNDKRATLNVLKERIQNTTKDLEELPAKLSRLLTNLENAYNNDKAAIEAAVQLTIAKIENDMLSFSTHFLKDRVNTFLQGWNDYLYDYFAVPVAQQKWKATQEEADKWLAEKIQTTSIQNRNS